MFPLMLLPLLGAAGGALTNLNNPDQMWKNMGIGAGIGGLGAGAGALAGGSLLGGSGAASMAPLQSGVPMMNPGLLSTAPLQSGVAMSNPGVMSMAAPAAGQGLTMEAMLKAMQFANQAMGHKPQQQQQSPMVAQQPRQAPQQLPTRQGAAINPGVDVGQSRFADILRGYYGR